MHTNITLTKLAEHHTWEEEHAVWKSIKEYFINIHNIQHSSLDDHLLVGHLHSCRSEEFVRYKIGQEMRRLGFK